MVLANKNIKKFICFLIVMIMSVAMFAVVSFAAETASTDQVVELVGTNIHTATQNNAYELAGGGSIAGSELFVETQDSSASGVAKFNINTTNYEKLSANGKRSFSDDIFNAIVSATADDGSDDAVDGANDSTADIWYSYLQNKGLGSKFMDQILAGTKPDFVSARRIWTPFQGIVNTILGILAIVGMALLGIVIVLDIFYIALPPVQMLVADEGGDHAGGRGSRRGKSKLFSDDAIYAVQVASEQGDAGGSKKQALAIYLKRRVVMLILLGICLLYLVSGSIYTLVSKILDLVSGFIGF